MLELLEFLLLLELLEFLLLLEFELLLAFVELLEFELLLAFVELLEFELFFAILIPPCPKNILYLSAPFNCYRTSMHPMANNIHNFYLSNQFAEKSKYQYTQHCHYKGGRCKKKSHLIKAKDI